MMTTAKEFMCYERTYKPNPEQYSSVRFIRLLKELDGLNDEMYSLKRKQEYQKVHKEFHRILSTDVIDGFVAMVDFLYQHLQKIMENKTVLIKRLHKPYLGDYISVAPSCHEDICQFYPLIASNLADLASVLQNFEWIYKFSIRRSSLEDTLKVISRAASLTQEAKDAMKSTRELLTEVVRLERREKS